MQPQYSRLVRRATVMATSVAAVLLLIKTIAWWYTGSVSLLAALVDSLTDIAASLTSLFVVRFSLQPPDEDHTFGHGKGESLAALAQSMFIAGSALFLLLTGGQQLITPKAVHAPQVGIGITLFSLLLTAALVLFQRRVVRLTQSQAISADMLHYQSDLLMNSAILVSLGLSQFGVLRADALFALGIGLYISYNALRMGYDAIQALLDRALPPEERAVIVQCVAQWPGIVGAHDLRTRQSGATRFIQFHIEMPDDLSLHDAHAITDRLEAALLEHFPGADILIHQDPSSSVPEALRGFTRW